MKHAIFFLFWVTLPFIAWGQANCPTFTRYGGYDRIEITPFLTFPETHAIVEDAERDAVLVGGTFEDQSLAAGLAFKFFFEPRVALRLKAIYVQRMLRDKVESVDTVSGVHALTSRQYDQVSYKIAPGVQWTFFDEHLSFFGGLELPITVYGNWTFTEYELTEQLNDTARVETYKTTVIPGGTSIGVGAFAGVQYYFTRNFAAGLEVGSAFQYTNVGGDVDFNSVTLGSNSSQFVNSTWQQRKYFGFTPVYPLLFITLRF
ncbi:MAG: hypothetical protein NZL95_02435 [Chitinophagales bacterium]|nr:hypothetical protein [Chitinophagales bacterium]MDW8427391.1 hypothetical protein [Chitinophagales bacterium]